MPTSTKKMRKSNESKPRNPPYIRMVFEAISATRHAGKGASRARIASYIKANWNDLADGAQFNSCLMRALHDGIERGVLIKGSSVQRFKITDLGRKERKATNYSRKYDIEHEEIKRKSKKKTAKKTEEDSSKQKSSKRRKTSKRRS